MSASSKVKIAPTAIVCQEAVLKGDITVGEHTVIHPNCHILATGGPIVIGNGNVIEETVCIENMDLEVGAHDPAPVMTIGNGNIICTGSSIHARLIGNDNLFESKSVASINSVIGSATVIGARVRIPPGVLVQDNQIIVRHPDGGDAHIQRVQKPYQLRAHQALAQQYVALFSDKDSRWYMGNFHRLL